MKIGTKQITVNHLLWVVYLGLLLVLLPHTAWAFEQFEPAGKTLSRITAWSAAFAFEAAIAALTHKLAKHIEATPRRRSWWTRFSYRYLNAYSLALVAALGVSSMANLAHAVEFGNDMAIFAKWGVDFGVYAVAFGAILPLVSLMFARVLSDVVESEGEQDEALAGANATIRELRRQLREAHDERDAAKQRFDAIGDLVARLFAEDKKQKIIAARRLWPALPGAAIAVIANASASYVSEVLHDG